MPGSGTTWGDDADLAYIAEVRDICRLAPERAVRHIERNTPLPDVLADMVEVVFGRLLPLQAARRMAPWPDLFNQIDDAE